LHQIEIKIEQILVEKQNLKLNKSQMPIIYKDQLKLLNKDLRKLRNEFKLKSEINTKDKYDRLREISLKMVTSLLEILHLNNLNAKTFKVSPYKQKRYLIFKNKNLGNLFDIYYKLNSKPMLVEPSD
jgi:hypothetical protein